VHINKVPERIVSLAPSITESLFALGLGDKVVGVTAYCKYPEEAAKIEKIGGYSDANLEKIVALHPDLVVATVEHSSLQLYLKQMGIPVLAVSNSSCAAICSSFVRIGKMCNAERKADSLVKVFTDKLSEDTSDGDVHPKVLLCVGRVNPGEGAIKSVYVAGAGTVYNEIIHAAGGVNAITDSKPEYPRLSPEGIIAVSPDIIIDIASAMSDYNCDVLVKDWFSLEYIPAVKSQNVYCISENYATVPGPRLVYLIDNLKQIIHNQKVN